MSSLWPSGGTKIVHKSVETGGCSSPPSRNTSYNLSGRSFIYESVQRGPRSRHGHSTVSARKSRFRHQSRKVLLRSNTEYGISRFRCEHSGYDSAPSQLQSGINKISLQLPASSLRSLCKGSLPVDWEVDCFYTSNLSCSSTLPSPPASQTPSFSTTKGLRCNNTSVDRGQGGITLVVSPSECLERACASSPPSRYSDRNGRIEDGLGGRMPGGANRGVMVSDGEKASHQLLGTPSRILRCQEFHKKSLMCPCEASHGQHFGCHVCKSPRGDSLPSSVQSSSDSVGMGTQAGFLSQRRTPIRPPEYRSGLAISELSRFRQLEIMPRGISGSDADPRTLCQGSFCGLTECTVASVFQLEADNAISSKVEGTRGRVSASNTCVAHTSVVPRLLDLSVSLPVLLPTSQNLLLGSQGEMHPLISNQTLVLAAWHISSNLSNRQAFVQTLPSSSWQLGGQAQMQFITPPGRNGIAGVSHGKVIHFALLWQI